jgi:two-component system sensor histidine kinase BarA
MKWPLWTSGIRSRLLLISILPVVVATVLLSWFSLVSQNESLSRAFFQSGDSVTAYIAATAELGMYAADRTTLTRLGASALKTPDVVGIGFIDSGINLLAASGDTSVIGREGIELCLENGRWERGLYLFFCKPVLESEQLVSDFDLDVKQVRAGPNQYGWVMLAVSRESMALQQQANAQVLLGVALIVVLAAALLAFRISESISIPVLSLEKTVNELDSGRLSSRAEVAGPSETKALARGINRLARSVAQSQEQLAKKVENSTRRVVTAMDALSKKNHALEKTQQALKLASTAKDDFLAKMSHELRTPLTTVVGFSRLLNQSKMNSKQVEYSDNITIAAELLLDTINNMLDFSKLQSSAVSIENIKFDLREAMEGLVAMHAYQAESAGLDLILIIDRNIPRLLLGDPTRIKQIVNNLLSNAVKFTKQGEVVLRVSLMKGENDDGSLSIEVIDSGIGMDEKSQARLFQPFTQADDTITRRFGGTGLGLVICKQLAELMGGDIVINSDLGVGTCMTVTLPLLATDLSFVMPVRPPSDFNVLVYDTSRCKTIFLKPV